MKIKRAWIECETDAGETILKPATADDLEYLRYRPNPEHLQKPTVQMSQNVSAKAEGQGLELQTWEPGPGYTREEIEALRLKPEDLRKAGEK